MIAIRLLLSILLLSEVSDSFTMSKTGRQYTQLKMTNDSLCNRRTAVLRSLSFGFAAAILKPEESKATYSAYVKREEDWQSRKKSGDINISTARDLRAQLREIAPMNDAVAIFCPNGPSSAVSPMMENKCGDRQAAPSVYGRSSDTVGNSIPGFKAGYVGSVPGDSSSLNANPSVGGFPAYRK